MQSAVNALSLSSGTGISLLGLCRLCRRFDYGHVGGIADRVIKPDSLFIEPLNSNGGIICIVCFPPFLVWAEIGHTFPIFNLGQ